MPHRLDRGRSTLDAATFKTAIKVGIGATDIKRILLLTAALTPSIVAANTSAEQLFTLTGVAVGDMIAVNKPTQQTGLTVGGVRVSATDQVAITFGNHTGVGVTPTAG